jgi:glutaredoxin
MSSDIHGTSTAILFTSKQCPHCPTVKRILKELNQTGKLASLDIFDVADHPQQVEQYHVRSVPWFKIGELEFQGLHTATELEYWVMHANTDEGILAYLIEKLKEGKLKDVETLIEQHPNWLNIAMGLISDLEAPLQARIGLGAIIEELEGSELLNTQLATLAKLTQHQDHRIRGDACHYLGFIASPQSKEILQHCLGDKHQEVREIAKDSLEHINERGKD